MNNCCHCANKQPYYSH